MLKSYRQCGWYVCDSRLCQVDVSLWTNLFHHYSKHTVYAGETRDVFLLQTAYSLQFSALQHAVEGVYWALVTGVSVSAPCVAYWQASEQFWSVSRGCMAVKIGPALTLAFTISTVLCISLTLLSSCVFFHTHTNTRAPRLIFSAACRVFVDLLARQQFRGEQQNVQLFIWLVQYSPRTHTHTHEPVHAPVTHRGLALCDPTVLYFFKVSFFFFLAGGQPT